MLCISPFKPNRFLNDLSEWCSKCTKILYKAPIKTSQTIKTPHVSYAFWCWPIFYCLYLFLINFNSFSTHHKTKKNNFIHAKITLIQICKQFFLPQNFKHTMQMIHMFIKILTVNQNIIKINHNKFPNEGTQNMVH